MAKVPLLDDDVTVVVNVEDILPLSVLMEAEQIVEMSKYCGSSTTLRWHQAYFLTFCSFSWT